MAQEVKVKWKPTPKIRAKYITAANLLKKIKQIILEEPARGNQGDWVCMLGGKPKGLFNPEVMPTQPACGTVGCIAGWGMILLRKQRERVGTLDDQAQDVMNALVGYPQGLGPTDCTCSSCQRARAERVQRGQPPLLTVGNLFGTDGVRAQPGTLEHAQQVAAKIDKYLAEHPELAKRWINVAKRTVMAKPPRRVTKG
jgi:hypothetical protein